MARSAATLAGDGLTYVVPRRLEISPALLAKWFIYMGGKVNASITGRDCRGRSRVLSSGFIIRIRRIRWLFRPSSVQSARRYYRRDAPRDVPARHEGAFIRTSD